MKVEFSTEIYLDARITGSISPYIPARINCSIENSYPAEGGELEDLEVILTLEDKSVRYITDKLPQQTLDRIEKECYDQIDEDFNGTIDFETQIDIPIEVYADVEGPTKLVRKGKNIYNSAWDNPFDDDPYIKVQYMVILTKCHGNKEFDITDDLPLQTIEDIEYNCIQEAYPENTDD